MAAYSPQRKNKYRVSRAYNKASTEAARAGKDKYGWTDGRCLTEAQARAIADNYTKAKLAFNITIRQEIIYDRYLGETVFKNQEITLYARPDEATVDSAMIALAERTERFESGGNSSTKNEILEKKPVCIKIYLTGRSRKTDRAPIDYQERMAWLIQHYGSKNAVETATGIPRRTQTRILQGALKTDGEL